MRIEALEYQSEQSLDIIIFVDFNMMSKEHTKRWIVAGIAYKELLVNKYSFLSDTYKDEDGYFQMGSKERTAYVLNKQIKFVGEERLREALMAAWNVIKPDPDQVLGIG